MQFTPALNRPPRGPNMAPKMAQAAPDKRWVLAADSNP